jgi:hypothetical protein
MTTPIDPDTLSVGQRLAFYLFTPWWRGVWFIGAIVWGVVFNVLYITGGGTDETFGIVSLVPIFAFVIEGQQRARKIRQAKLNKERL